MSFSLEQDLQLATFASFALLITPYLFTRTLTKLPSFFEKNITEDPKPLQPIYQYILQMKNYQSLTLHF